MVANMSVWQIGALLFWSDLILIGHLNHPEVIGTMGQLPEGSIDLIQSEKDVEDYNLKPGEKISVIIDQYDKQDKILYASQDGVRSEFNTKQLLKSYIKHPLMTFKIIIAIHFEAFKLWAKGIKFIKKKIKIKNNITIEN